MGHGDPASLRRAVGHDMFYSLVGSFDPDNAAMWLVMTEVQATFRRGEGGYDGTTRTYSESMRETLHWSIVYLAEDSAALARARRMSGGLLGAFVRLHPTAFKANGACELSVHGMWVVAWNTHPAMLTPRTTQWLVEGFGQRWAEAERAAQTVRERRAADHLPTTQSGYTQHASVSLPTESPMLFGPAGLSG